jgi:copper(I)-binding protein
MNTSTCASRILFILCFFSPLFAAASDNEATLVIENAWIAEAPPVSKVMVAYMTLKNTGTKDLQIISASSATYSSIEFHETIQKDGMATMIRHESLSIPASSTLELKRGGPHMMLFRPVKPLKNGDVVNIKLTTSDNTTKKVSVAVKKATY